MKSETQSLVTRIVALFLIIGSSVLGLALPVFVRGCGLKRVHSSNTSTASSLLGSPEEATADASSETRFTFDYQRLIKLFAALGCGAIIATGTVHIAPEAHEHFEEGMGGTMDYPYPMLISTLSLLFLYMAEHELVLQLTARQKQQQKWQSPADKETSPPPASFGPDVSVSALVVSTGGARRHVRDDTDGCASEASRAHSVALCTATVDGAAAAAEEEVYHTDAHHLNRDEQEAQAAAAARASIATHVLEVGIAVHSVLVGFALGMLSDRDQARNLGIALVCHQFCEGCALGSVLLESQLPRIHTAVLWAIFSCTTAFGVALGMVIEQAQGSDRSNASLLTQATLESVAFGILLYMALVDMLPNLFNVPNGEEQPDPPGWYRLSIYGALAAGCGLMSVLAVWA